MKLSEKILALRKARGMSQEELASALDVSRQAVSRWEGNSALPDANNVLQLSRLFGVTADYLLDDTYGSSPAARPAPQAGATSAEPKKESWWTVRRITGLCLTVVGVLTNLAIFVGSRFVKVMIPYITYENGQKWYTWNSETKGISFRYFVEEYSLEFLVAAGVLAVLVGVWLLCRDHFKKRGTMEQAEEAE